MIDKVEKELNKIVLNCIKFRLNQYFELDLTIVNSVLNIEKINELQV